MVLVPCNQTWWVNRKRWLNTKARSRQQPAALHINNKAHINEESGMAYANSRLVHVFLQLQPATSTQASEVELPVHPAHTHLHIHDRKRSVIKLWRHVFCLFHAVRRSWHFCFPRSIHNILRVTQATFCAPAHPPLPSTAQHADWGWLPLLSCRSPSHTTTHSQRSCISTNSD